MVYRKWAPLSPTIGLCIYRPLNLQKVQNLYLWGKLLFTDTAFRAAHNNFKSFNLSTATSAVVNTKLRPSLTLNRKQTLLNLPSPAKLIYPYFYFCSSPDVESLIVYMPIYFLRLHSYPLHLFHCLKYPILLPRTTEAII